MRLSRAISANIIEVVYGRRIADDGDAYLAAVRKEIEIFSDVMTPGRYLVEVFPFLTHLPSCFPGVKFKKDAQKWRPNINLGQALLYDAVERGMLSGHIVDSS